MAARRAYGGISADQRREQRRGALLDAALDIIGTQGFSALTVMGLTRATGLNDRYFTESFDSRDDLFSALIDQLMSEMGVTIAAAVAASEPDLHSRARAAFAAVIEYLTDDPRRARVALMEAPANRVVSTRRREVMEFFLALVHLQLDEHFGVERTDEVWSMAHFAGVQLFGALMETATMWLEGGLDLTRDELIDRTTELAVNTIEYIYSADRRG
ncbi:TetR/AcrR family transcriptional regulator [Nocardia aobensis]|uniref:TetR/AcrR family transcriptional regulator n=1 Tax=Nocardia aobensis TaxID=257277 RepID=A0ABW6NZD8_9NOCA